VISFIRPGLLISSGFRLLPSKGAELSANSSSSVLPQWHFVHAPPGILLSVVYTSPLLAWQSQQAGFSNVEKNKV
jgi:hypothetical protein